MRSFLFALVSVFVAAGGCSDHDVYRARPDPLDHLAVCSPESLIPDPRECMPEGQAAHYAEVWKREFMRRNGISDDYFDTHISSVSTSSFCWNSGVTFTVSYQITIGWAVIDRADNIVVMLYSSVNAYRHLNIPRDVFLDDYQIGRILDHGVFASAVGPVVPLEDLPYPTCSDAARAFQDSTGSPDILPTRIAYYVPGKVPREDGYPYFIGFGEVNPGDNECITGYFNLFTGEFSARSTPCVIE